MYVRCCYSVAKPFSVNRALRVLATRLRLTTHLLCRNVIYMNSSHYKSPSTKSIQLFHGSLALVLGCLSAVLLLEQLLT